MIADEQQFRRAQLIPGVALNLFLSQVFHWFFVCPARGDPGRLHLYKLAKIPAYYQARSNKSFQPSRQPFAAGFPGVYDLLAR